MQNEAGFKNVPKPFPMINSKGAIVYYLFFASQKPVAENIIGYIFKKYKIKISVMCHNGQGRVSEWVCGDFIALH
jgi:hypothetical protein